MAGDHRTTRVPRPGAAPPRGAPRRNGLGGIGGAGADTGGGRAGGRHPAGRPGRRRRALFLAGPARRRSPSPSRASRTSSSIKPDRHTHRKHRSDAVARARASLVTGSRTSSPDRPMQRRRRGHDHRRHHPLRQHWSFADPHLWFGTPAPPARTSSPRRSDGFGPVFHFRPRPAVPVHVQGRRRRIPHVLGGRRAAAVLQDHEPARRNLVPGGQGVRLRRGTGDERNRLGGKVPRLGLPGAGTTCPPPTGGPVSGATVLARRGSAVRPLPAERGAGVRLRRFQRLAATPSRSPDPSRFRELMLYRGWFGDAQPVARRGPRGRPWARVQVRRPGRRCLPTGTVHVALVHRPVRPPARPKNDDDNAVVVDPGWFSWTDDGFRCRTGRT